MRRLEDILEAHALRISSVFSYMGNVNATTIILILSTMTDLK